MARICWAFGMVSCGFRPGEVSIEEGLAQRLVSHLWARAAEERLSHSALVSVQGSQPFWERLGYRVQALDDPAQQRHLDSYGPGACYMAKTLG